MKIIYSQVIEAEKNNFVITVNRIFPSKQSFQERMNDSENTSYGPFENMSDAVAFLQKINENSF